MADETNQNDQSQEYSFPSEESQEYGNSPQGGFSIEKVIAVVQNNRIPAAIGAIVVFYLFLSLFGGSDEIQPVELDESSFEETLPEIQPEPVAFTGFTDLVEEESVKQEDYDKLQNSISSLNRQSTDFRSRLQALDQKIDDLSILVNRTATQLSRVIDEEQKKLDVKKEVVLEEYRIRAVISGRAWLMDRNGNNITVKVGDKVPTYGRITEIKPIEGLVVTSSGRVISFGSEE